MYNKNHQKYLVICHLLYDGSRTEVAKKMERIIALALALALTAALIGGCSVGREGATEVSDASAAEAAKGTEQDTEKEDTAVAGESNGAADGTEGPEGAERGNRDSETAENPGTGARIPGELEEIPEGYDQPARQQGTLTELFYQTYESRSYEEQTQPLEKRAIVYLPYGYSEARQYNVLYLMHGGWSDETTFLGTPEQPAALKNVLDNSIANGDFDPLIVVCPTYNNESSEDSADYSLAFNTLTVRYHNELVNDLIPAVEGTYSTYAASTSPEDIQASRDHRAFGGFSMGSVTTWYIFMNCLDEFRYFMPMSGAMDYEGDDVDAAVTASGHSPEDFFIFAMTGSEDFEREHFTRQIQGMLGMTSGNFTEADNEEEGNLAFRIKEGNSHNGEAAMEYTYNGLRWFWNDDGDQNSQKTGESYTADTRIADVINDPAFGDYGRLIFPVNSAYYSGDTLGELRLTWYSHIDPDKTVEIVNYMKDHAQAGDTIFYDIYTEEEKAADPAKEDTGLFFIRGNPGEKFAICSAGGRMAAYLGTYGPAAFGGDDLPRPGADIIQYTGHSEYSEADPPTYACVGDSDGIASWRTMERRLEAMSSLGIDTEFHCYPGLGHGFGLGTGTVAEGWIDDAIAFWERQVEGE